jgi:hypothetical protein
MELQGVVCCVLCVVCCVLCVVCCVLCVVCCVLCVVCCVLCCVCCVCCVHCAACRFDRIGIRIGMIDRSLFADKTSKTSGRAVEELHPRVETHELAGARPASRCKERVDQKGTGTVGRGATSV